VSAPDLAWTGFINQILRYFNGLRYTRQPRCMIQASATSFGSALIEKGLPDAKVRHEFRPEGVICTIELPVPEPVESGVGE
jgi:hypothetical protein